MRPLCTPCRWCTAHSGEVRQVVAPTPRAELDVVSMVRGSAAPRDRAEALVALEDLPLQGAPGLQLRLPDLYEVLRDPGEALSGGNPPSRGLAGGRKGEGD